MTALNELKKRLRPGQVYRRSTLQKWSNAVDRHIADLLAEGRLVKVSGGLYSAPRKTKFGNAPAEPRKLVTAFLQDDDFLMFSPNDYNGLGLGTTQLYNETLVYNRKRHGREHLDGQYYDFRRKRLFPNKMTPEFLLVDLMDNVGDLAEDQDAIVERAKAKARKMNLKTLRKTLDRYGSKRAIRELRPVLEQTEAETLAA